MNLFFVAWVVAAGPTPVATGPAVRQTLGFFGQSEDTFLQFLAAEKEVIQCLVRL
jgi:hypothetical protein